MSDKSQILLTADLDRQINLTADSAQLAFGSVTHASDALRFDIDELPPIFENLNATTEQWKLASMHAANILASGEHTASYYEKKLTTPASFARTLATGLLDVGAKAGSIAAGFVK